MKLLLDENLPKRLKNDFPNHQVFTSNEMGWSGKSNGELLRLMQEQEFDALLTFDKNLQHQQNFTKYELTVFVLSAPKNTYLDLRPLASLVVERLQRGNMPSGPITITG